MERDRITYMEALANQIEGLKLRYNACIMVDKVKFELDKGAEYKVELACTEAELPIAKEELAKWLDKALLDRVVFSLKGKERCYATSED